MLKLFERFGEVYIKGSIDAKAPRNVVLQWINISIPCEAQDQELVPSPYSILISN